jgi:DNA-binding NtrC family response regulator
MFDAPTVVVGSVSEAQAALDTQHFDAFIVDHRLPDGSGLELLAEVRIRSGKNPVLLLTGELDGDIVERARELEAEYVGKPASAKQLEGFVQRAKAWSEEARQGRR